MCQSGAIHHNAVNGRFIWACPVTSFGHASSRYSTAFVVGMEAETLPSSQGATSRLRRRGTRSKRWALGTSVYPGRSWRAAERLAG